MRRLPMTLGVAMVVSVLPSAQTQFSDAVRAFIKVDAPVVALTHVRVIDGTGAPRARGPDLIIRDGNIAAIGDADQLAPPAGATTVSTSPARASSPGW